MSAHFDFKSADYSVNNMTTSSYLGIGTRSKKVLTEFTYDIYGYKGKSAHNTIIAEYNVDLENYAGNIETRNPHRYAAYSYSLDGYIGRIGPYNVPDFAAFVVFDPKYSLISTPITADDIISIDEYVAGQSSIEIYIYGLLSNPASNSNSTYSYIEVGEPDTNSSSVKFLTDISDMYDVQIIQQSSIGFNISQLSGPSDKLLSDIDISETWFDGSVTLTGSNVYSIQCGEYVYGTNSLKVYYKGAYATKDVTYREVESSPFSNSIELLTSINANDGLCIRTVKPTYISIDSLEFGQKTLTGFVEKYGFIQSPIDANSIVTIDEYVPGKNELEVFIHGVKARKDQTYSEVSPTEIKFLVDVPEKYEITYITTRKIYRTW